MPSVGDFEFEDVIKILIKNGFFFFRKKGSHHTYANRDIPAVAIVPEPHGRRDKRIRPGTMSSIIRQSCLSREKWFEELENL